MKVSQVSQSLLLPRGGHVGYTLALPTPCFDESAFSNAALKAKLLVGTVPGGLTPPRMPTRILIGRSINQSIKINQSKVHRLLRREVEEEGAAPLGRHQGAVETPQ